MDEYGDNWDLKKIAFALAIAVVFLFSIYYLFLQPRGAGPIKPPSSNECEPFPGVLGDFVCDSMWVEDRCNDVCPFTRGHQKQQPKIRILSDDIYNVQYYSCDKSMQLYFTLARFQLSEDAQMCYEELFNITKICYEELSSITETHEEGFFEEDLSPEFFSSACSGPLDIQAFSEVYLEDNEGFFSENRFIDYTGNVSNVRTLALRDGNDVLVLRNLGYSKDDLLDVDELKYLIVEFRRYGGDYDED